MTGNAQGASRTVELHDNIRPALWGVAELGCCVGSLCYRWAALPEVWFVLICFGASICRRKLRIIHLLHITQALNTRRKKYAPET